MADALGKQALEAMEILRPGFSKTASRGAEEAELHQHALALVLRLLFLVCAESLSLMPGQLSIVELYGRLCADSGRNDERTPPRFGAYEQLLTLFRCVYFGHSADGLVMPARGGRLFDPEQYPLLESLRLHDDDVRLLLRVLLRNGPITPVQLGQVYECLMAQEARRRTGIFYTPPELTTQVVERTLAPLLACLGEAPTAEQVLSLRVCDPAMGSGAFLVAACKKLGEALVSAWTSSEERKQVVEQHGDPAMYAYRLIASRCLYGVDKDPMAVELTKLTLWLLTASRDLPFSFLDTSLRHGDSLVGLDRAQLEAFSWSPASPAQGEASRVVDCAALPKERLRILADACVGAFFAKEKDAGREKERRRRLGLVMRWLEQDDPVAGHEVFLLAQEAREKLAPFHWFLEFPAPIHAMVGNPPFGGKNNILRGNVPGYLDWLKAIFPGAHGNSDLSAFFFRRVSTILCQHGENSTFGLVATNTITQGDTRATGLVTMVRDGWVIYDATHSRTWPGAAAVAVSLVYGARGGATRVVTPKLDGKPVRVINSRLRPTPERADPKTLKENKKAAYVGTYVLGMGFTITPAERERLVTENAQNAERIFPYLGGEELNTSPTQDFDRYVINFGPMDLTEASRWPELLAIVRKQVKPLRENNKRASYRDEWWRFGEARPGLYASIAPLSRCLVTARISKHLVFCFQPTDRIFSEQIYVFPLDNASAFSVLQSRIHEAWARLHSSSLEDRLRYSASDCFDTFPFPIPNPHTRIATLEIIGEALHQKRSQTMRSAGQGFTKIYNALKNPSDRDPQRRQLQELHEENERQVLLAYGWDDIHVPPYCAHGERDEEAVRVFEEEVIERLYALNQVRGEKRGRR